MILLSRPHQHLARTENILSAAGISNILSLPLSNPAPIPVSVPRNATGIIFTSPFGIHPALPRLPAACVGEATAQFAEGAEFPITIIGTSNGESLARSLVAAHRKPQHFLHPHGDKAGMAWHAILQKAGHTVTPLLAYQTQQVETIPPHILKALAKNPPTHTLLFSAGSAKHLANLLKQANIPQNGTAICLSSAVAQAAKPYWPRLLIATSPSLKAMVACLKKDLAA